MFFKYLGVIEYPMFGVNRELCNIVKAGLPTTLIDERMLQIMNVGNNTPEQVAFDLYEDATLYWTILYVNNIIDPFTEWCMNDQQLYEYCLRVYGDTIHDTHHFVDITDDNRIINGAKDREFRQMQIDDVRLPEYIDIVTNFIHEAAINENKKIIKVIPERFISTFIESYRLAMK